MCLPELEGISLLLGKEGTAPFYRVRGSFSVKIAPADSYLLGLFCPAQSTLLVCGDLFRGSLNILDDGTSAMLQDRWGVVARIICATITDFSSDALVLELAKFKDIGFTCEYVGYLLFTNYGTNLESLLLEADRQEVLDKIVPFVYPNIPYKESLCLERFDEVYIMLNSHVNTREYQTLISAYVDYIESHQIYYACSDSVPLNFTTGETKFTIISYPFHIPVLHYSQRRRANGNITNC